jgi:hypothetical protein
MISPDVVFVTLVLSCGIAVAPLAAIVVYWKKVGRAVSDAPAKVVTVLMKLLAVYGSLRGSFGPAAQKDEWWQSALTGAICFALWEVVEKLVDSRIKAVDKLDKAELERARRQGELRTELLTVSGRPSRPRPGASADRPSHGALSSGCPTSAPP